MRRPEGKAALISGTARGQGRAPALRFAAEGALVVGGDLLHEQARQTVTVGSTAGLTGSLSNRRSAHSASKGAVIALTRQLAADGAPFGIRADCVSPGVTDTEGSRGDLLAEEHPLRAAADHIPLGRIGSPEDVVRAALLLASGDAAYITGHNLVVDGGWSTVLPGQPDPLP